jgi:tetratricopeptide (TPR) repeat protein
MKLRSLAVLLLIIVTSCSNSVEYSESFMKKTSGIYLYNQDEIIEVYYENNKLYLNWKGGIIAPVAIEENEFFVADMYSKFRFVEHPETKERYLSKLSEEDETTITYDYLKVPQGYKTPSAYLKEGNYEKALAGYLEIKEEDSTSIYIKEWDFNSMGYRHMRKREYEKAIGVLELNAALHPNSGNVYDSLAEAYLLNNDSLQAYNNYKKALVLYPGNTRAQNYVASYVKKLSE